MTNDEMIGSLFGVLFLVGLVCLGNPRLSPTWRLAAGLLVAVAAHFAMTVGGWRPE